MEIKIMERTYVSKNGVVEKTRFAVGCNTKRWKGKRSGDKCNLKKQTENDKLAIRKLARVLNCNFEKKDLLLTLTYSEAALKEIFGSERGKWESEEQMLQIRKKAEHQFKLWIRRVMRKSEQKIKYVYVTSDMDAETGELVRLHHHAVLKEGCSWDLLQKEWKHGDVDIRQIRDQDDFTPIAVYLLRQVRRVPEAQKYKTSKDMEKPVVEERLVATTAPIRVQPGNKILEVQYSQESIGQYVRYKKKKVYEWEKNKQEAKDQVDSR